MTGRPQTFRAFNGLRLLAALGVVCFHYGQLVAGFHTLPAWQQNLAASGPIALSFFFILSGFVLSYAYARRLPSRAADRHDFWYARFARLYPIYLVAFVLFLPAALEKYVLHPPPGQNPSTFFIGMALTLPALQSWTPYALSWNGPGWSLSVEAFFYFLFPWVIGPMLRMRWATAAGTLAALWLAMLALTHCWNTGALPTSVWQAWVEFNPVFWTPMFLLGILMYRLHAEGRTVPAGDSVAAALLALLLLLAALLPAHGRQILLYGGGAPLLALLILALARPAGWMSSALGGRFLFYAGAASYITYITQAPLWHLWVFTTNHWTQHQGEQDCAPWQFFVFLPGLVACSLLLHHLVEEPAKKFLLALRGDRRRVPDRLETPGGGPGIEAV